MKLFPHSPDAQPYQAWRRSSLLVGLLLGAILSGWYLLALRQQAIASPQLAVDPWFRRLLFILLIFVSSIFQCSLLGRLFAWLMRQTTRK